jgi:CheY-like chemotaxis protein
MLQEDAADLGHPTFVEDLGKIECAGRGLLDMINSLEFVSGAVRTSVPPARADRRTTVVPKFAASFRGKILVVDDDALNRDMLSRRLQSRGASVEAAESGSVALERIAITDYDLVVLDVVMPGMSGIDVLERIRQQAPLDDLPVILPTSSWKPSLSRRPAYRRDSLAFPKPWTARLAPGWPSNPSSARPPRWPGAKGLRTSWPMFPARVLVGASTLGRRSH